MQPTKVHLCSTWDHHVFPKQAHMLVGGDYDTKFSMPLYPWDFYGKLLQVPWNSFLPLCIGFLPNTKSLPTQALDSCSLEVGWGCWMLGFQSVIDRTLVFQNKNKNKAQFKYRFHFHPNHQSLQRVRWKVQVWLNRSVNQNSVYGPYIAWLIPVHTGQTNQIECNVFPYMGEQRKLHKPWVIWFSTVTNNGHKWFLYG